MYSFTGFVLYSATSIKRKSCKISLHLTGEFIAVIKIKAPKVHCIQCTEDTECKLGEFTVVHYCVIVHA